MADARASPSFSPSSPCSSPPAATGVPISVPVTLAVASRPPLPLAQSSALVEFELVSEIAHLLGLPFRLVPLLSVSQSICARARTFRSNRPTIRRSHSGDCCRPARAPAALRPSVRQRFGDGGQIIAASPVTAARPTPQRTLPRGRRVFYGLEPLRRAGRSTSR